MEKERVIAELVRALRAEVEAMERLVAMTLDEATGDESRAENKYDTRSLESSYLAAGQGERLLALRRILAFWEGFAGGAQVQAGIGSLVGVDGEDGGRRWFLLAPDGGGRRVMVGAQAAAVVTADSPAGQVLFGASEGDEVRVAGTSGEVAVVA